MGFYIRLDNLNIPWLVLSEMININSNKDKRFVEKFKDYICWTNISWANELNATLINEYADYLIWPLVVLYQEMDYDIVVKHEDKIPFAQLSKNFNLCPKIIRGFFNKLNLSEIVKGTMNLDETTMSLISPLLTSDEWNELQFNRSSNLCFRNRFKYKNTKNGRPLIDRYVMQHRYRNNDDVICDLMELEIVKRKEFVDEIKSISFDNYEDKRIQMSYWMDDFILKQKIPGFEWFDATKTKRSAPRELFISHREFMVEDGPGLHGFICGKKSSFHTHYLQKLYESLMSIDIQVEFKSEEERNEAEMRIKHQLRSNITHFLKETTLVCEICEETMEDHYTCLKCKLLTICTNCFHMMIPNYSGYMCFHSKSDFVHGHGIDNYISNTEEIYSLTKGRYGNSYYKSIFQEMEREIKNNESTVHQVLL